MEVQIKFEAPEDLKTAFYLTCKAKDRTAAQVFRDFMRAYVRANGEGQMELFAKGR